MIRRRIDPWIQLGLFVLVEALIYLSYRHHDGRFHWFLHFFVGATAALLALTLATYWSGRVLAFPLLWIFVGHLVAMFPDILFAIVPHQAWMDVFLLHISVHFTPGRNWTWYAIFLASLACYLAARSAVEARPMTTAPRSE